MRISIAAVALLVAAAANAVTIVPGDIADAPPPPCWGGGGCIATPPPPAALVLDNAGAFKAGLTGPYIVAFGPNGHLFTAPVLTEYDTSLAVVRHLTPPFYVVSMTIAQNGDIYILSSSGTLAILSPTGTVKQTFAMPFTTGSLFIPASLDLDADQCTMFYTDGAQNGRRFNACSGQPLPDLAPGAWTAVRAMSDGGYIAAQGTTISVFDAQNHLLRTLTPQIETVTTLAFDADPQFVWAGTVTTLTKVRLADGLRVSYGGPSPLYLAVNGEHRPAAANLSTAIPMLSPALLLVIALGLIALAWQRLRA